MANFHYETNPITIVITGFKKAFAHSQQLAVMLIVIPMILGVVNFIAQIFSEVFSSAIDSNNDRSPAVLVVGAVLFILAMLLTMFVQVLYVGFQSFAMIKISRGEDETLGKALEQAFSRFWKVVAVNIMIFIYALPYAVAITLLIILNIIIGMNSRLALAVSLPVSIILAIANGVLMIRVYLRFAFAVYYLFDGNHTPTAALEKSKHLTRKRLSEVFGVTTISSMVPFVSSLCLASGMAVLYSQLTYARETKTEMPRQHLLNYLVPLFALVFLGMISFVLMAIYLAANQ